jgi:hypothetical protein
MIVEPVYVLDAETGQGKASDGGPAEVALNREELDAVGDQPNYRADDAPRPSDEPPALLRAELSPQLRTELEQLDRFLARLEAERRGSRIRRESFQQLIEEADARRTAHLETLRRLEATLRRFEDNRRSLLEATRQINLAVDPVSAEPRRSRQILGQLKTIVRKQQTRPNGNGA